MSLNIFSQLKYFSLRSPVLAGGGRVGLIDDPLTSRRHNRQR